MSNLVLLFHPKNFISLVSMRQKKRKFIMQTSQVDVIEYIFSVSWNFEKFIFFLKIPGDGEKDLNMGQNFGCLLRGLLKQD
jgi:hypothetical protein